MSESSEDPQTVLDHLARAHGERAISFDVPFSKGSRQFWIMQIPIGEYWIGRRTSILSDEIPRHEVRISNSYALGQVPVTKGLWDAVQVRDIGDMTFTDPSYWLPKVGIKWHEAIRWLDELQETIAAPDGFEWRLPSEKEWEVGCRAGTITEYWNGDDRSAVTSIAWFRENSHGKMSKVVDFPTEQAKDHPFGLLHMHGLVNEWCQNEYDEHAYIHAVNGYRIGRKPKTPLRVYRGGSWKMSSNHCRSSSRFGRLPGSFNDNKGIRLCLAPKF